MRANHVNHITTPLPPYTHQAGASTSYVPDPPTSRTRGGGLTLRTGGGSSSTGGGPAARSVRARSSRAAAHVSSYAESDSGGSDAEAEARARAARREPVAALEDPEDLEALGMEIERVLGHRCVRMCGWGGVGWGCASR